VSSLMSRMKPVSCRGLKVVDLYLQDGVVQWEEVRVSREYRAWNSWVHFSDLCCVRPTSIERWMYLRATSL
jgi:hypothetical protein